MRKYIGIGLLVALLCSFSSVLVSSSVLDISRANAVPIQAVASLATPVTESQRQIPPTQLLPRLVDEANLLSDSEERELLANLDEISTRQQFDVAVVTVASTGGKTPRDFADDFYDYNGYGYGTTKDGVLLLLSMAERDWYITTTGYGITAITDAGLQFIGEKIVPDLSDGKYAAAFGRFADWSDRFVSQARTGQPYDIGNMPKEPVHPLWIPGSLLIGLGLALIPLGIMRAQLRTVHKQPAASAYVPEDGFRLNHSDDYYLYSTVNRVARPKDNDSGGSGGSSTHVGSSGSSHGGGGGKF